VQLGRAICKAASPHANRKWDIVECFWYFCSSQFFYQNNNDFNVNVDEKLPDHEKQAHYNVMVLSHSLQNQQERSQRSLALRGDNDVKHLSSNVATLNKYSFPMGEIFLRKGKKMRAERATRREWLEMEADVSTRPKDRDVFRRSFRS